MLAYLKTSTSFAVFLSCIAILLGLLQIVGVNLSTPSPKNSSFGLAQGSSGVLLIQLNGPIYSSGGPSYQGDQVTNAKSIIKSLEKAKNDPQIRGIILEINSPGGAINPTKRIYEKVLTVRKSKPIVAVVGDMAASGAYYVASACNHIVASQTAIIGSIGVLSVRFEIHQLLKRFGIKAQVIKAGRFKDIGSPFRKMRPEERKMEQNLIDEFYSLFLKDVSEGRNKPLAKIKNWVEGRIFSATQALKLTMIDSLGGTDEGLKEIKKILKTEDDLKLIEPQKDIDYYIQKFLSTYASGFNGKGQLSQVYTNLLQMPFLYLYPQWELITLVSSPYIRN